MFKKEDLEIQEPDIEEHKSSKNEIENEDVEEQNEPESYDDKIKRLGTVLDDDDLKFVLSLNEQKKHWRNKHEKLSVKYLEAEGKKEVEKDVKEEKKEEKENNPDLSLKVARLELREQAMDRGIKLDNEDLDNVFALSKGYGIPPEKVFENNIFKSYLINKQETKKDAGTSILPSSIITKKSSGKEYSLDDLAEIAMKNPAKYEKMMREKYG